MGVYVFLESSSDDIPQAQININNMNKVIPITIGTFFYYIYILYTYIFKIFIYKYILFYYLFINLFLIQKYFIKL